MSEYYHIDWKFSDNTLLDIDLLNIIMSYGDPCINQQFKCVLKQVEYLSKEFDYLRNGSTRSDRLCTKKFYRFALARTRQKLRLMRKKNKRAHQELANGDSQPVNTPPPSPVSLTRGKDYRTVSDASTSMEDECDTTHQF